MFDNFYEEIFVDIDNCQAYNIFLEVKKRFKNRFDGDKHMLKEYSSSN